MASATVSNKQTKQKIMVAEKTLRQAAKLAKQKAIAKRKVARKAAKLAKQKAIAERKAAREAARLAKQKAIAERKVAREAVKLAKHKLAMEILARKTCLRISKMVIPAATAFQTRQIMRNLIQQRKTKGTVWNLNNAVVAMLKMPYYKNEAATSGAVHNYARHEDAIARILIQNGFLEWTPITKLSKKRAMRWLTHPELAKEVPNGTFIEQPFGTHNAPDFIIKHNDKCVIFLEAKSSATACHPTYNSGGVKPDFLYVFCSKKINQTTIFKGESVITLEQQRLIAEHIMEARKRDEELNKKLRAIDMNHRGIAYYTRPMIIQSGGGDYTNYFAHANRSATETAALDWIKSFI